MNSAREETRRVLREMLTENTGRAGVDFDAQSASTYVANVRGGQLDLVVTHSVYHWLCDVVDFDAEMDAKFIRWCNAPKNKDESWFSCLDSFVKALQVRVKRTGESFEGPEGRATPWRVNTANGENCLSQELQWYAFEWNGDDYQFIEICNGADSRPRAFRGGFHDSLGLYENAKWSLYLHPAELETKAEALEAGLAEQPDFWPLDVKSHAEFLRGVRLWWDFDGHGYETFSEECKSLEEYEVVVIDDSTMWQKGKLCVLRKEKQMLCPVTGVRLVSGW